MDFSRRVAGGVNGGAQGGFVKRLMREDNGFSLRMGGRHLFH